MFLLPEYYDFDINGKFGMNMAIYTVLFVLHYAYETLFFVFAQPTGMEKGGVFLFLLVTPSYCFPLLKDNALDLENDAMLYDEAAAKEAGSYHCI
jgi:hypothetical protein